MFDAAIDRHSSLGKADYISYEEGIVRKSDTSNAYNFAKTIRSSVRGLKAHKGTSAVKSCRAMMASAEFCIRVT